MGSPAPRGVPSEWLAGSPFHSYTIPSLVLLLAVGGGMFVADGLLVTDHRLAGEAAIGAGLILVGLDRRRSTGHPVSWMQPTFLVLGIAVVKLGDRQHACARSAFSELSFEAGGHSSRRTRKGGSRRVLAVPLSGRAQLTLSLRWLSSGACPTMVMT
jgi:hypothetical protein